VAYQQIATVDANQAVRCEAWSFRAKSLDITYKGRSVIVFEDGKEMSYETSGDYNTVQYTEVQTSCRPEDPDQANDAIAKGETEIDDKGNRLRKRRPRTKKGNKGKRGNNLHPI
jgi:hypothetical protein